MNPRNKSQRKGRPIPGQNGANYDDGLIDASPDAPDDYDAPQPRMGGARPGSPRNLQETKVGKEVVGGIKQGLRNYKEFLGQRFVRLPRRQQEQFIMRMSQTITIGSAMLVFSFFYTFLPTLVRVMALPIVLVVSWWLGTKVVSPQMANRFSQYLNEEF